MVVNDNNEMLMLKWAWNEKSQNPFLCVFDN